MGSWRLGFEDFWDREGLGITFWTPPYPKIGSGKRYSQFSLPRSPPPTFVPLYMLGLEPETCGDRMVRGLSRSYRPVFLNYIMISISYLI